MNRIILTFGLISGAIAAVMMFGTLPFAERIGFDNSAFVGYTLILLSALPVYFGIRSYRDNVAAGTITFGRAFTVGIGIALISTVCYVISWEILYFGFMPDFMDHYGAYLLEKAKAAGAGQEAIDRQLAEIKRYRELFDNPFTNAAMTFLEPLPIHLLAVLLSSAVLRRPNAGQSAQAKAAPVV